MRSAMTSALLLAAVSGCGGTLSNDDIAFFEAVPRRDALHVKLPPASGQALSTLGPATVYTTAREIAAAVDAGLDGILGLLDLIRGVPPTTRTAYSRTWGPFPDREHPGVQDRALMTRELNPDGSVYQYRYVIEASRPPGAALPILEGTFYGAQARNGAGKVVIHFENSQALGIARPSDPREAMFINYDFTSDPKTLELDLGVGAAGGFGLPAFNYGYASYADGHGRFDYGAPDGKGNVLTSQTSFTRTSAGRALIVVTHPPFFEDRIVECWDDTVSLTYIDDPGGILPQCNRVAPCVLGDVKSCPALP